MSSTARIRYEQPGGREVLSGSANWAFDNGTEAFVDPGIGPVNRTLSQWARLAFFLAVSSMTAGPDPWAGTQQQRSQLTMSSTSQTSSRRRITLIEAREMALAILSRAEAGRAAVAEAEAKQGIDWEDIS